MNREPLLTIGLVVAAVASFIVLLRAFGVPITPEQQDAIEQFLVAAGPVAVVLWARQFVTPLSDPRDATGEELTRPDGSQAVTGKELR